MAYDIGTARGVIEMEYNGRGIDAAKRDLTGLQDSGKRAGMSMDEIGRNTGRAGLAIAAALGAGVMAAANFEQRMSAIKAVSGATGSEMDKISAKALQLGKDTAFSASESAMAMEELIKAGLSVDDVLNGAADATVALAAAGEIDLPQAATIASNAMNQFNLSAKDMPKVADAIAGAANASAIDVSEFGQSLQQVGAVANLAGVDFKDTATAIAIMGNAGIKGSDAGTSLKSMFMRLQPVTEKQKSLFKELGIITEDGTNKFYDQEGNLKSLADVSGILQNATKGMTKEQKQMALQTMFGSDAIRAAAILSKEGAKGFEEMATSMGKVTAADVAAERLNNFKGSLEQLKGSLETAGIVIGGVLLPYLRQLVDAITAAFNWFLNLGEGTQKAIVAFMAASAGILLTVAAVIKIINFIKALQAALITIRAVMATTWLAALGPIALVVAAIAAVVAIFVVLWKKNETFRNAVIAAWNAIKSAAQAVAQWFMSTVVPMFQNAWNMIKGHVTAFIAFFKQVWSDVQTIAGNVWKYIGPAAKAAFDLVVAIVKAAWDVIKAIFTTYGKILLAVWKTAWDVISTVLKAAWNVIKTVVQSAITIVKNIILGVLNVLKGNWKGAWENMKAILQAVWNVIKSVVTNSFNAVKGVITSILNGIKSIWNSVWNGIKSVTSAIWNGIKSVISAAVNAVRAAITAGLNGAKAVISSVWNAAKALTSAAWNAMKSAVQAGIKGVISFVKALPGQIKSALGNLGSLLVSAGKDLVMGFVNGIKGMAGAAIDAVKGMASDAISAAKSLLKIGSPSKVFEEFGKWVGQGFIKGVTAGRSEVTGAFAGMIELLKKKSMDTLASLVVGTRNQLIEYGKQYDVIENKLEKQVDRLKGLQDQARQLAASTKEAIADTGDITSLAAPVDAEGNELPQTFDSIVQGLVEAKQRAAAFNTVLQQLQRQGLNKEALNQIIQAGPEEGLATAQVILAQGDAAIARINQLQRSIATSGAAVGKLAGQSMYGAGIESAKGIIRGLRNSEERLENQMQRMARQMGRGMLDGLRGMEGPLVDQARRMADRIIAEMNRALKIKSPSRVMQEIGEATGEGFLVGLASMVKEAQSVAGDLALSVPAGMATPNVGTLPAARPTATAANGASPTGDVLVKVYLGDRELTDLVRVEISETLQPLRRMTRQGAL